MGRNPFKAMTKKVNAGFKKVGSKITDITNQLKCPVSIFSNIPKCGLYFIEDLIMLVIWFVLWLICFFILYLPIAFFMKIYCALGGVYFCEKVRYQDICPSKQFVSEIFEMCFQTFGVKVLLRSSGDVKKCYCIAPLKMAFQPLTSMKYTKSILNAAKGNNEQAYTERLIIALVIFGIVIAVNVYGCREK